MRELTGQTALITGAARRLGRAVALAAAAHGANVAVHFNQSRDAAEWLCAEINGLGVDAWAVQADLSQLFQAESLIARVQEMAGPIDILVNNASIFPASTLMSFTPEELHENIRVNALAPFLIARAFAAAGQSGAIINFLDTRISDYDRQHVAYHLSKRMLFTLTRMMALEFAPGIRVNAVAPGLILPPEGEDETYLEKLASTNPLETYGDEADIAEAVVYLLRADFVTGQVLYVDGGRHLRSKLYD